MCEENRNSVIRTTSTEAGVTLLIDETGPYNGAYLLPDVIVIEISCSGDWSITPED